jgi:hypothetical protein
MIEYMQNLINNMSTSNVYVYSCHSAQYLITEHMTRMATTSNTSIKH